MCVEDVCKVTEVPFYFFGLVFIKAWQAHLCQAGKLANAILGLVAGVLTAGVAGGLGGTGTGTCGMGRAGAGGGACGRFCVFAYRGVH